VIGVSPEKSKERTAEKAPQCGAFSEEYHRMQQQKAAWEGGLLLLLLKRTRR
jgi:hypothetical protein